MNTVLCKVTFTAKRQIPGWLGKPGFCSWLGAGSVRGRGPHGLSGDSLSWEVQTCSPSPPVGGPTLMFYQLGTCEHGCQALGTLPSRVVTRAADRPGQAVRACSRH